jgi:DNA-binding transcriptional regulator LsrR (DeoR family)
MAIVGVGSIEPSDLLAVSGNAFPPEDRDRLLAAGAGGDICHHLITVDGTDVTGELGERTIAIPVSDYRAIARRIGIAGGRRKHEPILGALTGGWINVLITDVRTAEALVDDERSPQPALATADAMGSVTAPTSPADATA